MDSKEIKMGLIKGKIDNKKLGNLFDSDFKDAIQGLFNTIFVLMRDPVKNDDKINNYFDIICNLIDKLDDKNKLNFINKKLEDVLTRVDHHLVKKNTKEIKNLVIKLREIASLIRSKTIKNTTNVILETLIFEDRDLVKLSVILDRQKDIFKSTSHKNLFRDILTEFVSLDENDELSIYYFKLISLILSSNNRNHILDNKDEYVKILHKRRKFTKPISAIMNKFDKNYIVSTKELELRYDMSFSFPKNVEKLYSYDRMKIKEHNFTRFPSVTIDEEGNTCNDDAICLIDNHDGSYILRIDIASVPVLVPHMSYLDMEAYKRSETIYLSDMTIPIYPDYISYDQGSLLENNVRHVLSYMFLVDSNFDVIEDSFKVVNAKTLISNNLSFKQANILINSGYKDSLSIMLRKLSYIASKLDNNKVNASLIDSNKMIEKFMKLISKNISNYCKKEGIPFNYRVHQKINEEKRRELIKHYHVNELNNELLKIIEQKSCVGFYSSEPTVHQSLGLDVYAKVTSPLRSYASGINEYIIYDFIIKGLSDNYTYDKWNKILKDAVPYMNERIKLNSLFSSEYEQVRKKNKILRR